MCHCPVVLARRLLRTVWRSTDASVAYVIRNNVWGNTHGAGDTGALPTSAPHFATVVPLSHVACCDFPGEIKAAVRPTSASISSRWNRPRSATSTSTFGTAAVSDDVVPSHPTSKLDATGIRIPPPTAEALAALGVDEHRCFASLTSCPRPHVQVAGLGDVVAPLSAVYTTSDAADGGVVIIDPQCVASEELPSCARIRSPMMFTAYLAAALERSKVCSEVTELAVDWILSLDGVWHMVQVKGYRPTDAALPYKVKVHKQTPAVVANATTATNTATTVTAPSVTSTAGSAPAPGDSKPKPKRVRVKPQPQEKPLDASFSSTEGKAPKSPVVAVPAAPAQSVAAQAAMADSLTRAVAEVDSKLGPAKVNKTVKRAASESALLQQSAGNRKAASAGTTASKPATQSQQPVVTQAPVLAFREKPQPSPERGFQSTVLVKSGSAVVGLAGAIPPVTFRQPQSTTRSRTSVASDELPRLTSARLLPNRSVSPIQSNSELLAAAVDLATGAIDYSRFGDTLDRVLTSLSDRNKHFDDMLKKIDAAEHSRASLTPGRIRPKSSGSRSQSGSRPSSPILPSAAVAASVGVGVSDATPDPTAAAQQRLEAAARQKARMAALSAAKPRKSQTSTVTATTDEPGDGNGVGAVADVPPVAGADKKTVVAMSRDALARLSRPVPRRESIDKRAVSEDDRSDGEGDGDAAKPPKPVVLSPASRERHKAALARLAQPRVKPQQVVTGTDATVAAPEQAKPPPSTQSIYGAPLMLKKGADWDKKGAGSSNGKAGTRRNGKSKRGYVGSDGKPSVAVGGEGASLYVSGVSGGDTDAALSISVSVASRAQRSGGDWGSPVVGGGAHNTTAATLQGPHTLSPDVHRIAQKSVDFCLFCGSDGVCGCDDSDVE